MIFKWKSSNGLLEILTPMVTDVLKESQKCNGIEILVSINLVAFMVRKIFCALTVEIFASWKPI